MSDSEFPRRPDVGLHRLGNFAAPGAARVAWRQAGRPIAHCIEKMPCRISELQRVSGENSTKAGVMSAAHWSQPARRLIRLLLGGFLGFQRDILLFCGGVILVMARYSFCDLFRGELTVVFRVQHFG